MLKKQKRIHETLAAFVESNRPATRRLPRQMGDILHHIHDNLFDPDLNVTRVKQDCRLSNNNVTTKFRLLVGIGMRTYIETLRMQAASLLLSTTDIEIFLISAAVGYNHQETFCRAFLRQFSCTPSTYRQFLQDQCDSRKPESRRDVKPTERTSTIVQFKRANRWDESNRPQVISRPRRLA